MLPNVRWGAGECGGAGEAVTRPSVGRRGCWRQNHLSLSLSLPPSFSLQECRTSSNHAVGSLPPAALFHSSQSLPRRVPSRWAGPAEEPGHRLHSATATAGRQQRAAAGTPQPRGRRSRDRERSSTAGGAAGDSCLITGARVQCCIPAVRTVLSAPRGSRLLLQRQNKSRTSI